jgi:transcriptional regulator with XRE-family HTH domain
MQSLLTISPLRRARLNLGRTLLEIQLATGISTAKLSAAERGLVRLTQAEQRVVAEALGADPTALFGNDQPGTGSTRVLSEVTPGQPAECRTKATR